MIVFIGAGLSKLFGIPDTKGFVELFDKEPKISENDIYTEIKRTFGDFDLEVLMTISEDLCKSGNEIFKSISPQTADFLFRRETENRNYYVHDKKAKEKSADLLESVKKIIRNECFKAEKENKDKILDVYDGLFEIMRDQSQYRSGDNKISYPPELKIVTTNYDRCIETYFRERQIDYAQGLRERFGCLFFDISSFNDGGNRIGLFKLHGTIDLFNIDGEIRQRRYGENIGEEIVYYPIEFGGYSHIIESPYLELFYLFRDRIDKCFDRKWIIIGSSMRDRTICSIMNDVIRTKIENQRPRIVFVNPDETVIERLKSWGFNHLQERMVHHHIKQAFGTSETNNEIGRHLRIAE